MFRRFNWGHTVILATALGLVAVSGCESATAPEPRFEQNRIVPLPGDGGDGGGGGGGPEASPPVRGKERAG